MATWTFRTNWLGRVAAPAGLAALSLLLAPTAEAAVPATLGVQGAVYATAGGVAPDGTYDLTFAVYKDEAGGQALWTEGPVQVSVQGGIFSYALGSKTAIDPAVLATAKYVGIAVGQDPELPRRPLLAVAFALRAGVAEALDCSGCVPGTALKTSSITSDKVGFAYAGGDSKGGSALKALDLQCTGCVSVSELGIDADLDLKDKSLKGNGGTFAGTVTAKEFVGDGSKLTGIAQPKGKCAPGKAVIGISPDGELLCGSATDAESLPPDGLNEISNDLLTNQFVDVIASTKTSAIPDNNPLGVEDSITMPDIGIAQKLTVSVDVTNSNIADVLVTLTDPAGAEYVLYSKTGSGTSLKDTYPDPTAPVSGDLTTWVGKNPKGVWKLKVVDSAYKDNKTDGQINKWSINLQTMSNKKVQIKGDVIIDGQIVSVAGGTPFGGVFTRWGTKNCPTGSTKLYDGAGFSGHYSYAGPSGGLCVKGGDPGPTTNYEGDLLYPMHTSGSDSAPPGITANRSIYCSVCQWTTGGCFEQWGSHTCPTGFKAAYTGYGMGGHYTHPAPGGHYCIDNTEFDASTSATGNGYLYNMRLQSGGGYGGNWPSGRFVKCSTCCR